MSMAFDVVIAAAGAGGRMSEVNPDLHKALLPYLGKPILWHLINGVPASARIIILVGSRASQIRDFCKVAFPERDLIFIYVDDWTSEKSGTAYSLLQSKSILLDCFWYLPCDGVFSDSILSQKPVSDKFWVKRVNPALTHHYETFACKENKIISRFHKLPNLVGVDAFTGVMFISNTKQFMENLETSGSTDFTDSIQIGQMTENLPSWLDLGNPDEYLRNSIPSDEFDFSKTSEYTFQFSTKVIKWWNSSEVPLLKMEKPIARPEIFPSGIEAIGQFLSYNLAPGETFYNHVTPDLFRQLLGLLEEKFWTHETVDISDDLQDFYLSKTCARIELMGASELDKFLGVSEIDGESVMDWKNILNAVPWEYLTLNPVPSIIHGDLQFDNIIFDCEIGKFTLIDWRPDFGRQTILGDRYYDFAKLLGGIRLNYSLVKKLQFGYDVNGHSAVLTIPRADRFEDLEQVLHEYIDSAGLDFTKVEYLVPIVYWNMAPLHKEPFKSFLWLLGIKYLSRLC